MLNPTSQQIFDQEVIEEKKAQNLNINLNDITNNNTSNNNYIKCPNILHANHRITSLCMKNSNNPNKILTLNCSECVKETASTGGDHKEIIFSDYPEIIFSTHRDFKEKLVKIDSERHIDKIDVILDAYEALGKEFLKISDYFKSAAEEVQRRSREYAQVEEKEDYLGQTDLFFTELIEKMKLSKEKHIHEEMISSMTKYFNLFEGQFILKDHNTLEKETEQKLSNIQFLREMGEHVWKKHEEVKIFNRDVLTLPEFIPFKRNTELDRSLAKEAEDIIKKNRKSQNENQLLADIQRLQIRFKDLPVPICSNNHSENKLTSICLHNPRDPGSVLSLNCGDCIKELSGKSQEIIFKDYPEAINRLFLNLEMSPKHSVDKLGDDVDFIEKKFDQLIQEVNFYSEFLKSSSEAIFSAKDNYLKGKGLQDFKSERIEQFIKTMEQLTTTKIDQTHFENYLKKLKEIFPLVKGEFSLEQEDIQKDSLIAQKKAIHFIKQVNTDLSEVAEKIIKINEKYLKKSEKNSGFSRNKKLEDQVEKLLPKILSLLDPQPAQYIENSVLLKNEEILTLKEWVKPKEKEKLRLIFRASKHGFINFQRYCVGKANTLIVIQSDQKELILGGFTPIPWNMRAVFEREKNYATNMEGAGNEEVKRKTFLYSLSNQTRHFIKNLEEAEYAIFGYPVSVDDLFCFGRGFDLIVSQTDQKANASNFGKSYELPKNISFNSKEAKEYLGGAPEFQILEIEVYQLEQD